MGMSNAVSPAPGSHHSSRSSSRKSSVDQGYTQPPPPPPPAEEDDSGCFFIKILILIGIIGAAFGAGIGVGSAIWNEECESSIIDPDFDPTLPPDLDVTFPDFTTEVVTGTEMVTGTAEMTTIAEEPEEPVDQPFASRFKFQRFD